MKNLFLTYILVFATTLAFSMKLSRNNVADISTETFLQRDSNEYFIVASIKISGNEKTKEKIILRELTFQLSDTIKNEKLSDILTKSKENLLKTSLFNYVTFETSVAQVNQLNVTITVEERWYLWPYLVFDYADRNFAAWLKHKDLSRLNYGTSLTMYNFRGCNENLMLNLIFGYNQNISISYSNLYLDKARRHAIWLYSALKQQNQIGYITKENTPLYLKNDASRIYKMIENSIYYSYRKNFYITHYLEVKYSMCTVADTIVKLNPNFLGNGVSQKNYISIDYEFQYDARNSKIYPLTGRFFNVEFKQFGLDLSQNSKFNYYFLNSSYRIYSQLNRKFYFSFYLFGKKSTPVEQPYLIQRGLGYKDNLFGYEYYVIDGQDYITNQTMLKFEFLPTKIYLLKFIPFKKFNKIHFTGYINIYGNLGYVKNYSQASIVYKNTLVNSFLYSYGIGIDIVSYYDNVLRIAYSRNKLNENSFFIDMRVPF